MNRFVITLTWTHTPDEHHVTAVWDGPNGTRRTYGVPRAVPGPNCQLTAENAAVARMVNVMTETGAPFTHLEIVRN